MACLICSATPAAFACRAGSAVAAGFSNIFSPEVLTGAVRMAATAAADSPETDSDSTEGFTATALAVAASVAFDSRRLFLACRGARARRRCSTNKPKIRSTAPEIANGIQLSWAHIIQYRRRSFAWLQAVCV